MDNETIDLGKWYIPKNWNDITLRKFQEIKKFYNDTENNFDVRQVLHILCDKTMDEVNELPVEFLDIILNKLSFLNEQPKVGEPSNKVTIDGQVYQVNTMQRMKTGEYVAADSAMKNDKDDFASILAIMCRKPDEKYDSKFEAELFEERKKMFEEQPITKILPIVNFFLSRLELSLTPSLLYSKVEEELSHIRRSINNSQGIGIFRKLFLRWQVMKLQKSMRSGKNMSQIHSSFSHILSKKGKWKK